ncbi:MAG: mycofactocin biosynthesis glycosyltransferase MftF [Desertimonas sp.]
MRYTLDPSTEMLGDGSVVLGGSPRRLFRLTTAGATLLARLAGGGDVGPSTLVERLLAAGAIHPIPTGGPFTAADVTVVVPAWCAGADRLATIAATDAAAIIVIDDASPTALIAPPGVDVRRRSSNGGPGAARNSGAAEVTTHLVAFVDTDVTPTATWLDGLLGHFADQRVAAVAPRVRSQPGQGALARYELDHSPLDLGCDPATVAPGTRVGYVPAAALVVRTDAFGSVGGFDESLRTGEDVDLIWRLVEAGHVVRYEPGVVVDHQPRRSWAGMARQRLGYGESAAPLARRHRGALAPVRINGWTAVVWALLVAGRWRWAAIVALATTAALVRKLRDVPVATSVRLAGRGHLGAGRQLTSAARRVWWPLVVLGAARSRRGRMLAIAAAMSALGEGGWRRLLDDAAYGAGVWRGVIRTGEVGPLLPSFAAFEPPDHRSRR